MNDIVKTLQGLGLRRLQSCAAWIFLRICHTINCTSYVHRLVMEKKLKRLNSLEYYGPRYKLEVLPTNAVDHNPPEYLERIK